MAPKTVKKGVATSSTPEKKPKAKTTKASRETRTDFSDLPEDYNKWINNDLKDLCRQRKLPIGGNKAALVGRLKINDEVRAGEIGPGDEKGREDESTAKKPVKAPVKKAAGSGKPAGLKKTPKNGFKAGGGKKKGTTIEEPTAAPSKEPTSEPPLQVNQSEIDRAKRYYERVWEVMTKINEEDWEDAVFDDVLSSLASARDELKAIRNGVVVEEEKEPEVGNVDAVKQDEEDDEPSPSPSPSPSSKRPREEDDDEDHRDDGEPASKSPRFDAESEESEEE